MIFLPPSLKFFNNFFFFLNELHHKLGPMSLLTYVALLPGTTHNSSFLNRIFPDITSLFVLSIYFVHYVLSRRQNSLLFSLCLSRPPIFPSSLSSSLSSLLLLLLSLIFLFAPHIIHPQVILKYFTQRLPITPIDLVTHLTYNYHVIELNYLFAYLCTRFWTWISFSFSR